MTAPVRIELPTGALPASAAAAAWLEARFRELAPESHYELDGAWMLGVLGAGQRERLQADLAAGRVACPVRYVRPSLHAPLPLRRANRELGLLELERWPGIALLTSETEGGSDLGRGDGQYEALFAKAGLVTELQRRADTLAAALASAGGVPESVLRPLLPAIAPAGLGGHGDARTEALARALLEDAHAALDLVLEPPLELPARAALPRRVGELRLEHPLLQLRWRRKLGLCWTGPGLRECGFVASLEVQGDGGGREAFRATHPARPRWFEVAHMQPRLHDAKAGVLHLTRTLRLPETPGSARLQHVDTALTIWLDAAREDEAVLDLELRLLRPVPGQRYRLALPVPFWPRPGVYPRPSYTAAPELWQFDGLQPAQPVLGSVSLAGDGALLIVSGPGLREVEVSTRKNEQLLHLTIARLPEGEPAPPELRRRFRIVWRRVQG